MNFSIAFNAAADALPYMLGGVGWTVGLIVGAMLLGLALGVPLSVLQVYGPKPVRRAVSVYVWLFRGVPILVQLYIFYFGLLAWLSQLPVLAGLGLDSPFVAAVLVLGLTSSAYQSQIFRGAIQSLPAGQLKAARALGMTDAQAIRTIILPQALRLSIPGWSNEYSILLKDSALAFTIGVVEIMARMRAIASTTREPVSMAFLAGIIFFVLTWVGVKALAMLENKVRIAGYTRQGAA
ncbi:amino acid ABC transporter membrane protein 1, PAAT family [Humidesulfovibrio mexicanus]|uniref:Amino acid ABC transporter membrane protein 1, PAAT family n=1 Tax=Humidesulfovibrio mexicanus TaxID=147047 RepID=A0A239B3W7_9BACT|nr:amino acid ABC transporter permease [Humidesulfovibrio mexicanus]SNS01904.1 amino acid ABC transporter membrane protein 1, PAAT family [Humidesulfovibrio mexicanus]